MLFGNLIMPWTKHVRTGRDLVRRAFDVANAIGDLAYATYSCNSLITNLLAAGDPLVDVQREAEEGLEFAEKARFGLVIDIIAVQLGLIRTLRGLTPIFGCFNDERFDELRVERRLSSDPMLARAACSYWMRKLQARFFAGDYVSAVEASVAAQHLLRAAPAYFETAEAHFYGALSHAASCDAALPAQYRQHVQAVTAHHRQLAIWAEHCPENFENRAALVGAEIARLEGRELDAERLYEQAIHAAHANGFVHNEAIAYERASAFYRARGFDEFAETYLWKSRACYARWGAEGKVRHLDQRHPHLRQEEPAPDARGTIGAPLEHLELATVLKVSQAVSGEIVLEKLLETLMRTAIEHAGAERALLILWREAEQRIAAEATTSSDTVIVQLRDEPVTASVLPETVLRYVLHTQESVLLDDAATLNPFSADPYIGQRQARSVLCLPLSNQAKLIGVLYLENNLAPRVFAPARIAVLTLLASQAAISLENTRLYRDLAEREAKIRRLVDANIIGIALWDFDGRIIEANDAFLSLVGYSREDLASGRMSWPELTPADWRAVDQRQFAELRATGRSAPVEKEYVRKDGRRAPVLIGSALFEGQRDAGVSFVLDLTERKRAEESLRQTQAELEHATRMQTLGELTASIAHEINQPLGAVVNNASACVRWLAAQNLEEARRSAALVIADGHRAADIIGRIRALAQKAPPPKDWLDLNATIRDVLALARSAAQRHGVAVETHLAEPVPLVRADRIQLQQVLLNVVINAIEAMSGVGDGPRQLVVQSDPDTVPGVRVTVRDSGPGLDPQHLDHLFDAFYTTKANGLGLGLAISRRIIEAHGGRLWARANVPHGAVFQFTVPIGSEEGA